MHSIYQATSATCLQQAVVPSDQLPQQSGHWALLFQRDFQLKLADTPTEKQQTYRLRHQVYCEELAFEPANPIGIESDAYDLRSLHYLLYHRQSQQPAGTMRTITCTNPTEQLPVERYFRNKFTQSALQPSAFSAHTICEFSRLALASSFRRQHAAEGNAIQALSAPSHHRYLAAALYLAALEHTTLQGYQHAYAVMAPALARILIRVGLPFQQISTAIELNGLRAAYYLELESSLKNLCSDYQLLRQVLSTQLLSAGISKM